MDIGMTMHEIYYHYVGICVYTFQFIHFNNVFISVFFSLFFIFYFLLFSLAFNILTKISSYQVIFLADKFATDTIIQLTKK